MDIRKLLFNSNKSSKYDIYDHAIQANQTFLHNDSVFEYEHHHYEADKSSINFPQNNGNKKSIYHSTPLDVNPPRQNVPFSSITSISSQSISTNETGVKLDGSQRFLTTPKKVTQTAKGHLSSFFSSLNTSNVRTPNSSSTKSNPGSSRFSKGSSTAGRTPTSTRTPGSTRSLTDDLPPTAVVAIVEGRGQARREIGMAAIDLNRPLLTIVQFSDTHTYTRTVTKLSILNPLEILFANTAEEERLMKVVRESIDGVSITTVQRKYFNESRGLAIIKHLAVPQCNPLERQISTKYYCLSAVAALIRYVEQIQNVTYAPHSLMVTLSSSELILTVDYWSSKKLELVRNLSKGWEHSLFGAIRYTSTPSGTRMLRASLLQPFADLRIIETRLFALEYLTQNPELFYSFKDTEARIEQRLNYVISLKNTLELLQPLKMALETVENPFFVFIKNSITGEEVENLLGILRQVLHEDARLVKGSVAMRTQRCYAIKSNINGLLDVARKIYSEIVDDIITQVESLAANYEIPTRVGHNSSRGFHVVIPLAKKAPKPNLAPCFIQVQMGRGCITCTTEEIYQLDQRSRETLREILIMSNVIILELMCEIRDRVGALYGVAEAVAILDMVVGLAHAASLGSWIRPEFSTHLAIRGGRHAILDLLSTTPIVPNNTLMNEEKRIMIISGPNMSGKSTYLKQVALIQVLAQIGSFVPAEVASLRLVDHLFTLLGCEDNPENNSSTFQVQMNEVSVALQMAGSRSLILLDELGQGTNIEEGMCLGWAIVEGLLFSKAFVVFATHIRSLTRLADLYPQISNYYMESSMTDDKRLHLSYLLRKGVNEAKNYGLSLAVSTPLPRTILQRAYQVSAEMEESNKKETAPSKIDAPVDDAVYLLAHRLLAFAASIPTASLRRFKESEGGGGGGGGGSDYSEEDGDENLKTLLKEMLQEFLSQQNEE